MTLLALQYWDRVQRTQAAWDQAEENDILIREAECQIDVGLFLDEYPQWELGTPQQSVILHEMFLHATERGQKEAEHMVCWGRWGSVYNPNSEADQSAMELVGYHTSQKEMRDIYQSVYLLQRAPGLPSCRDWLRRKAIQDILSSLKGWLHRHGHSATARDLDSQEEEQVRLNRWGSCEEALRVAHQRALDTADAPKSDIERLSQRRRDRSQTHPKPTAEVEVTLGPEIALGPGADLGATAEIRAKIVLRAAHGMYASGPLMDPHPEEE